MMIETPVFFGDDAALFGVYHEPEQPSATPFIFCHPFAEEKLWAHRVFVSFARILARAGHPVMRFDYRGNGDSTGDFCNSSLTTVCDDVRNAIADVQRRTGAERINLLGLRFGATVAALVAEERPNVDRLVLWAPIVDGNAYMQELLRINVTTQMAAFKEIREDRDALVAVMQQGRTVNIDGYDLAYPMYSQVSAVTLADAKTFPRPCLVAHVDRQPDRPAPGPARLAGTYGAGTFVTAQEEPFWKEIPRFYQDAPNLFDVTLAWLAANTPQPATASVTTDSA
jgi:exosortase A-associated hydrolase 2